ncbi:serpin family protein [Halobacillus litoralis]|uniref:serpin family protein n=1 Tax=Halobacillus litoralis TaxID=45668 RepID=UPI001CD6AADC|nr:serpin family protein [Halobacillus litoralis]MCA0972068.1 serpin family protein [Halobacillus litoralis]
MKRVKWIGLCVLLLLTACGQGSTQAALPVDKEKIDQQVLKGNQQFAFELFQQMKKDNQNVFMSPYSISVVMSMVLAGAEGETETEMKDVMNYGPLEDPLILDTYHNYTAHLQNAGEKVDIQSANSIWLDEAFSVKDDFKKDMTDAFRSEVFQQELSNQAIVDDMNGWVSDKTNGMIDTLIQKPYDGSVRMLLNNAIYFNGKWKNPFEESMTTERDFTLTDGTIQKQKLMFQEERFDYLETEGYQAVQMPYGEGDYSMYAFLPKDQPIDDFVMTFNAEEFRHTKESMQSTLVELTLPKFKVEYGVKSVKEPLMNLGMESVFSNADLSAMSDAGLYVDDVIHKAVIDVTEEGTEAAAVTQASVEESAAVEPQAEIFKADRPFFYVIADDEYDSILFMGTYEGEL